MNGRRRALLAATLGAALLQACGQPAKEARFPAPALLPLDGSGPSLAEIEGALLVNYWATWCAPCRDEMPSLERLSSRLPAGVRLVAVSVDEDANLAREWLRKLRISFPVFIDPGTRLSREPLGIVALPETFLVGSDRRILLRARGAREWDSPGSLADIERALPGSDAKDR